MDANNETTQVVKKKKKWLIPVIIAGVAAIVLAIIIAVVVSAIIAVTAPKRKAKEQMDAGDKYLLELDYEKAILAYKEALRIDPKNVDAYLALCRVYEAMADDSYDAGDLDGAVDSLGEAFDVLDDGEKETSSDEIKTEKKRIEEKKAEIEKENSYHPIYVYDAPLGLEDFIDHMAWYGDFKGNTEEEINGVMETMLGMSVLINFSEYPGNIELSDTWDNPRITDADGVGWILKNIFNFDDSLIAKLKEDGFNTKYSNSYEPRWSYDKASNTFRSYAGGVGDGPAPLVKRVIKKGDFYYVESEIYWWLGDNGDYQKYYTLLEYKTIDGKGYWTIHEASHTSFMEWPDEELPEAEDVGTYLDDPALKSQIAYYLNSQENWYFVGDETMKMVEYDGDMVHVWIYQDYGDNNIHTTTRMYINRRNGKGSASGLGRVDLYNP